MEFRLRLLVVVLLIAALSIVILILSYVGGAQPSPVRSLRLSGGVVSYYVSLGSVAPPGLVVRVYAVNGSRVYPVPAFVAVYGLTPRHIVPMMYGFGSVVNVPFNNSNWFFVASRWLLFNPSVNEYDTSILVFVTYMDSETNESWIEAYSVPYNIGWVMNKGSIRYIVLTAYINLTNKPFRIVPANPPIAQGNQSTTTGPYTAYNCSEQGPSPPTLYEADYYPTLNCYGFQGPIPLTWVTWDQGITNEYKNYGLDLILQVDYSGTFTWDATGYSNGFYTIGPSYSANVNWYADVIIGSDLAQPGTFYLAYNGAFALVNYTEYYYNIRTGYVYVGNVAVSEVISVSTTSGPPRLVVLISVMGRYRTYTTP